MEQNTIEQLKSLKALLDSDILNQEEYEKEKAKLLSKPVVADTISVQISKEENETILSRVFRISKKELEEK